MFSKNDDATSHKTFFDDFQTDSQASSLNDDEGEPSGSNISSESDLDDIAKEQSSDNDQEAMQIVLTGNNINEINNVKKFLSSKFKIKDLGELKYFLSIKVLKTDKGGLCLSQRKYCLELLHDYGLLESKPVSIPQPENIILAHKEKEGDKFLKNITNYQRLIGKLIYMTLTRPNISYSVHCLSQHMHAPLQSHMHLGLRVLMYLKGALQSHIDFDKFKHMSLKVYVDSDWDKCPVTRRSVSGYCVVYNGCLVS
nr:ribonuclease H-like domain-containing protein [Tanacetum cinerariifolium]